MTQDGIQGAIKAPWQVYQRNELDTEFILEFTPDDGVPGPVPHWDTATVEVTITTRDGHLLVLSSATSGVTLEPQSVPTDPTVAIVTLGEEQTGVPLDGWYTVDVVDVADNRLTYRYGPFRIVRTLPGLGTASGWSTDALALHAALRGPGSHLPDGDPNDNDVPTWVEANQDVEWKPQAGGGGGAGNVIVRKFPFAFNTPHLSDGTGAALYIPTVGDVLLDAWISIDTAWDGTSPISDFISFDPMSAPSRGLFQDAYGNAGGVDMTLADSPAAGVRVMQNASLSQATALGEVFDVVRVPAIASTPAAQQFLVLLPSSSGNNLFPSVPLRFATTFPVKMWVSQNGWLDGADPASTQGAATLYLVTATPV